MDPAQENLERIVTRIDGLMQEIKSYPKAQRAYTQLYSIVTISLAYLENKEKKGWFFKTTTGDIGSKYHVHFNEGLFSKKVVVQPIAENGGPEAIGVYIERKLTGRIHGKHYAVNHK